MLNEIIPTKRGTNLRKNDSKELTIFISQKDIKNIFLINGHNFNTDKISSSDLIIKPSDFYMIINRGNNEIEISYDNDISNHEIIYNPYKHENAKKINIEPNKLEHIYNAPNGYIDTLSKWYSFKFSYLHYNLIFVKPEMGLSIQTHQHRNEFWEILAGEPIIISGNRVYYFVRTGTKFQNLINTYHSVINPNQDRDKFVILKEGWSGDFDEKDINRFFNPNQYFD